MPTVTVAIPLHGSAPWIDNVVANVRALSPMVTEIIISDMTCIDDAADKLRIMLADDLRVRIKAEAKGLGFAEHFQFLLESAKGEFFMWMPHDDIFNSDWVPVLSNALVNHPEAWLAFGQLHCVKVDGNTPLWSMILPAKRGLISRTRSMRLMMGGYIWSPFRGLFRRQQVLTANIRMNPEDSLTAIDTEWVFCVALYGHLVYDDRAVTWKRLYEGSTHTTDEWNSQQRASLKEAAINLINKHGPHGLEGCLLKLSIHLNDWVPFIKNKFKNILRKMMGPKTIQYIKSKRWKY